MEKFCKSQHLLWRDQGESPGNSERMEQSFDSTTVAEKLEHCGYLQRREGESSVGAKIKCRLGKDFGC